MTRLSLSSLCSALLLLSGCQLLVDSAAFRGGADGLTGDGSVDGAGSDARGGDGATDDGAAEDAAPRDARDEDGAANDGGTIDGAPDDGATGDAAVGDGATGDASTGDGSTGDGAVGDGAIGDGSAGDGSAGDGSAGDGSAGDGSAGDGSAGDGGDGASSPCGVCADGTYCDEPTLTCAASCGAAAEGASCGTHMLCYTPPGGGGRFCFDCDADDDGWMRDDIASCGPLACGDGAVDCPTDCDETDASVYPFAQPDCSDPGRSCPGAEWPFLDLGAGRIVPEPIVAAEEWSTEIPGASWTEMWGEGLSIAHEGRGGDGRAEHAIALVRTSQWHDSATDYEYYQVWISGWTGEAAGWFPLSGPGGFNFFHGPLASVHRMSGAREALGVLYNPAAPGDVVYPVSPTRVLHYSELGGDWSDGGGKHWVNAIEHDLDLTQWPGNFGPLVTLEPRGDGEQAVVWRVRDTSSNGGLARLFDGALSYRSLPIAPWEQLLVGTGSVLVLPSYSSSSYLDVVEWSGDEPTRTELDFSGYSLSMWNAGALAVAQVDASTYLVVAEAERMGDGTRGSILVELECSSTAGCEQRDWRWLARSGSGGGGAGTPGRNALVTTKSGGVVWIRANNGPCPMPCSMPTMEIYAEFVEVPFGTTRGPSARLFRPAAMGEAEIGAVYGLAVSVDEPAAGERDVLIAGDIGAQLPGGGWRRQLWISNFALCESG